MDGLDRLTGEGLSSFQRYTNASLNPMMESDSSLCSLNMLNGASASFQRVVRNSFQVTDRETLNSLASFFNGAESLPSKTESEKRQAEIQAMGDCYLPDFEHPEPFWRFAAALEAAGESGTEGRCGK